MYLVVGLGNPGKEYVATRHNLGFMVIEELLARHGHPNKKDKPQALIAEVEIARHKVILAQPQTFMNNSGLSVAAILHWYKITSRNLLVLYDDVDLEVGAIRLREKGAAGGHHGMESVIAAVGTTDFPRVRVGIGRPTLMGDVSDYVLQPIPSGQSELLNQAVIRAAEATEAIITGGVSKATN